MTGYCEDPSAVRPDRRARRRARARRDRKDKKTRAWGRILRIEVWKARKERGDLPEIDEADILAWADAHHARTGQWPTSKVGEIPEEPGETWMLVEAALFFGLRGLPGRTTLLRFLSEHWVRSPQQPSDFTVNRILTWADAYHERTGRRPITTTGHIPGADGITWKTVDDALRAGRTDRPAGLSLSRLLTGMRGVFRHWEKPALSEAQILAWADAHHQRNGSWPTNDSGWIVDAPGETWQHVDEVLLRGIRGLAGGSSLPRLLAARRGCATGWISRPGTWNGSSPGLMPITSRTGRWPHYESGPIAERPGRAGKESNPA